MKVHITLVGAQPAPVYNGIIATNPDRVVFVYSEDSDGEVKAVMSEIDVEVDDQPPLSPTNPNEIVDRAKMLAEKYKNDEVTVNISSGLKSWSHLFARVFDPLPNATIVYMDQNNILWNYRTMQPQRGFVFDMDVQFRLMGNALKYYVPFSEYTSEDHVAMNTIMKARRYNFKSFNAMTAVLKKEWKNMVETQKEGRYSFDENNSLEWRKPDHVQLTLFSKKYGPAVFEVDSPHAFNLTFNSGWFEYKVARMLSHWSNTRDIRMNCIFPPKRTPQKPKNEVDIVVDAGEKVLFVECKTQIEKSTDIDKFRTVVKNYGGMGSKALFVTDAIMSPMNKEKCVESGILYFSLQDPIYGPNIEQALFKVLDSKWFNINPK